MAKKKQESGISHKRIIAAAIVIPTVLLISAVLWMIINTAPIHVERNENATENNSENSTQIIPAETSGVALEILQLNCTYGGTIDGVRHWGIYSGRVRNNKEYLLPTVRVNIHFFNSNEKEIGSDSTELNAVPAFESRHFEGRVIDLISAFTDCKASAEAY